MIRKAYLEGGDSVLLDLDGTLVDSARMVAAALDVLCRRRGACSVGVEAVRGWISLGADVLIASALGMRAMALETDLAEFREILEQTPADPQAIYPGVEAALGRLSGAGLRLAVVTNKPAALSKQLLSELGLSGWFDVIVGGDSAPFGKPHPAPLRMALAAMGGDVAAACMVGDSVVDAKAAAGLGMPFYLYSGGYGSAHCPKTLVSAKFAHFHNLPNLLLEAAGP